MTRLMNDQRLRRLRSLSPYSHTFIIGIPSPTRYWNALTPDQVGSVPTPDYRTSLQVVAPGQSVHMLSWLSSNNDHTCRRPRSLSMLCTPPQAYMSGHVHDNCLGPLFTNQKVRYNYCLVLCDRVSRFPVAFCLPSLNAECVCNALLQLFQMTGIPSVIQSDCGTNFTSKLTQTFLQMLGVVRDLMYRADLSTRDWQRDQSVPSKHDQQGSCRQSQVLAYLSRICLVGSPRSSE